MKATGGEGGKGGIAITEENLPKMKNVVILQDEGIIYCPIAKVMSCAVEVQYVVLRVAPVGTCNRSLKTVGLL